MSINLKTCCLSYLKVLKPLARSQKIERRVCTCGNGFLVYFERDTKKALFSGRNGTPLKIPDTLLGDPGGGD
jgi:hypothetical protein